MKPSLFRVWRENRLIERAMHESASPTPPADLKDRLIQQAQLAEAEANQQRIRPKPRLIWALPAAAFVLAACWIAVRNPQVEPSKPTKVAERTHRTSNHSAPVQPKKLQTVVQQPKTAPIVRQPRMARSYWHRKTRHIRHSRPLYLVEKPETQSSIRVSISREPEATVSYARVAAYSADDSGKKVRTAWTLVDDPQGGMSHQEMAVDDNSGRRQILAVSVVMPAHQPKGEEL